MNFGIQKSISEGTVGFGIGQGDEEKYGINRLEKKVGSIVLSVFQALG